MSKYYVVTEEGVEGTGCNTPLEALVEYLEFSDVTEERLEEVLNGKSEINYVQKFSQAELERMPEV